MQENVNTQLREKAIVERMASNAQIANVDIWGIKTAKLMGCKTEYIGMAKGRKYGGESKHKSSKKNMVLQRKYSDKLREQKTTVNVKYIEKKNNERRAKKGKTKENIGKKLEKTLEKTKAIPKKM